MVFKQKGTKGMWSWPPRIRNGILCVGRVGQRSTGGGRESAGEFSSPAMEVSVLNGECSACLRFERKV